MGAFSEKDAEAGSIQLIAGNRLMNLFIGDFNSV
jgi:hypothetical protein